MREPLMSSLVSADGRMVAVAAQSVANRSEVAQRPRLWAEIERRTRNLPGRQSSPEDPELSRRLLEISKQTLGHELVDMAISTGFSRRAIHAVGFPLVMAGLLTGTQENIQKFLPICTLVIALALLWLLRRPLDSVLPLLCVGPALVWSVAIGGYAKRLSIMTSIAPIMVLVVGVSDVVHLITQFRHELRWPHVKRPGYSPSVSKGRRRLCLDERHDLVGFDPWSSYRRLYRRNWFHRGGRRGHSRLS
ncbi:MAG: hypothetical protein R3C68_03075 [Myxococcota bacterium]